jgi:hypothetical protein
MSVIKFYSCPTAGCRTTGTTKGYCPHCGAFLRPVVKQIAE